jgi:hypothetical protein
MSTEMIELIYDNKAHLLLISPSIRTGTREALNEKSLKFLYRAYRHYRLFLFYIFST